MTDTTDTVAGLLGLAIAVDVAGKVLNKNVRLVKPTKTNSKVYKLKPYSKGMKGGKIKW